MDDPGTSDRTANADSGFEEARRARLETRSELARWEADLLVPHIERLLDEDRLLPDALVRDVPDVEDDARRFGRQLRYAVARRHPIACLLIGDVPLPVELSSVDDIAREHGGSSERWEPYRAGLLAARLIASDSGIEIAELHPLEARSSFMRRVRDFLAARFTGTSPALDQSPTVIQFKVVTKANGLRIYASPAYLLRSNARVFGAPTSPVIGPITPGRWIFGAQAGTGSTRWDRGEFAIPPSTEASLNVG